MDRKLDKSLDIAKTQQEVLQFWEEDNTFEKSLMNRSKEVVFYDGPPFPTGKPHHGTVLVSFIKDMIARYFTMKGYAVPRTWGWDCHGLPIEVQAENELGIENKTEIERTVGVDKFNDKCFEIVSRNNDTWKDYVKEMARWVDYDHSYKTMDKDYMESVIWAFKELYDKKLIYKDYRVTPYCCRCETPLSISETREDDATRPKQDRWVIVRFNSNEKLSDMPVYFLAWTTTPWTLPSNMALAVNDNIEYAYVAVNGVVYVANKKCLESYKNIFGENPNILKVVKGSDLVGKTYTPLFDYFKDKAKDGAFKIISADYVAEDEGVGIVHIAPAFGEDDYWACKKSGVPLVCPVDDKGMFTSEVRDFASKHVFDANPEVIRFLKEDKSYVADGSLVHNYPHCWRCGKPLIYKAMDAWYVDIDALKSKLIEKNQNVNWVPEVIKNGRFNNWLLNARDWNISRNRYWSTPIPVWTCNKCGKMKVMGSIKEIEDTAHVKVDNLHKQYLDKITFKCDCGGEMKRVSEVLDCWFESGSAPFARKHFPFENKDWFLSHSPSDFVVEYTGQIRCWFYYLHVLSVALFDRPAFKNCIVHGTILAKDGKKLSKKSKNYTDPMLLMKEYGTDAFRLYLYQSNAMLMNDLLFDENGLKEANQQILLPLYSCTSFFVSYAEIDGFHGDINKVPDSDNSLDKWVLARLYQIEKSISHSMDKYQVDEYVKPVADFIDDLSNWYIRRSRRRFWAKGMDRDKINAYETLYYVLTNLYKIMAPITPILIEKLYKSLTGRESVHLEQWPNIDEKFKNEKLLSDIKLVQKTIYLARTIRTKNNIKNRQPLNELRIASSNAENIEILREYEDIIKEEINVYKIAFVNYDEIADRRFLPNFAMLKSKYPDQMKELIGAVRSGKISFVGEKVIVEAGERSYDLDQEDVLIEYLPKSNMPVAGEKDMVVSLDLAITEELRQVGIAREIVRKVQDARKQSNYNLTDRILLDIDIDLDDELKQYICNETLATLASISDEDMKIEFEGSIIKIKRKN